MDYIYPGSIPMRRVNWQARNDYEYVQNYKLLQVAFDKHRIRKHIDVDRLIRAKYQDNLEFCQWLKAFFDQAAPAMYEREGYDPVAVRSKGKGGKAPSIGNDKKSSRTAAAPKKVVTGPARRVPANARSKPTKSNDMPFSSPAPKYNKENIQNSVVKSSIYKNKTTSPAKRPTSSRTPARTTTHPSTSAAVVADAKLMKANDDLTRENAELKVLLAESEREQKFYYEKLRSVEMVMEKYEKKMEKSTSGQDSSEDQDNTIESLIRDFKKSLYASDEDEIPLEDELLSLSDGGINITAMSNPENDLSETSIQQPSIENNCDILQREMMQSPIGKDEEPSLMIQDDSSENLVDSI